MSEPITLLAHEARVASDLAHAVIRSRQNVGQHIKDMAASLAKIIESKDDPGKTREELGGELFHGVWFSSLDSGMYYRQPHNCGGEISAVMVNGVWFAPTS